MNFIKIIRNLLLLGLGIAFIVTTIQALTDLIDGKIGSSVTTEEREEITLPSWTLCPFDPNPNNVLRNASNLHELTTVLEQIPLNFSIFLGMGITFNMTDKKTLEDEFNVTMEETWHVHCKGNFLGTGCDTCITFHAPIKTIPRFFAKLFIEEYPGKEAMILQLHDSGNSLALNWEYNWSQVSYFVFKKGKT